MVDSPSGSGPGPWQRLDAVLRTNPDDAGCSISRLSLDAYAELSIHGDDPAARYPGVAAHLESCPDCRQDLEGLIAALSPPTD